MEAPVHTNPPQRDVVVVVPVDNMDSVGMHLAVVVVALFDRLWSRNTVDRVANSTSPHPDMVCNNWADMQSNSAFGLHALSVDRETLDGQQLLLRLLLK